MHIVGYLMMRLICLYITCTCISLPKLLGTGGELIVYPCSIVRRCRSHFSKNFFSETAWPIKFKFHVSILKKGEPKFVFINGPGHVTKMAARAINSKNLKKSSSPEPEGL